MIATSCDRLLACCGCVWRLAASLPHKHHKPDPVVARVLPPPTPRTDGAIYQSGQQIELFADLKARRVGDVLTIRLTETTSASKSAVTKTTKTTGVNNTGPDQSSAKPSPPAACRFSPRRLAGADSFDGEGSSTQGNSLAGSLTVTVMEVQSNGNLVVQGDKTLKLNQGDEFVHVSGVVRRGRYPGRQHGHLRQSLGRAHQLLREGRDQQFQPHGLAGPVLQFRIRAVLIMRTRISIRIVLWLALVACW